MEYKKERNAATCNNTEDFYGHDDEWKKYLYEVKE